MIYHLFSFNKSKCGYNISIYQVIKKVKTKKETNEICKIYTAINCKFNLSNKCFTKINHEKHLDNDLLLATINKSCLCEIKLTMTVKERPAAFQIHLLITLIY